MQDKMQGGPKELISCNLHFKSSVSQYDYPYFDYVISLFTKYDSHGLLAFPGSLADQPAKYIELMELLKSLDIERQQKEQREQARERDKLERRNKRKK